MPRTRPGSCSRSRTTTPTTRLSSWPTSFWEVTRSRRAWEIVFASRTGSPTGVTSRFSAAALDPRATFTVTAISNPQNITKVAQAVREEIERLRRDGVADTELARAKAGY